MGEGISRYRFNQRLIGPQNPTRSTTLTLIDLSGILYSLSVVNFYTTPKKTIDPPAARLLAIHYAIARILYISRAGGYINHLIQEMEVMNQPRNDKLDD